MFLIVSTGFGFDILVLVYLLLAVQILCDAASWVAAVQALATATATQVTSGQAHL